MAQRVISVRNPYPAQIISGEKPFEGRGYSIRPGRLYIHAGKQVHAHFPDLDKSKYVFGAIIGYVDVVSCQKLTRDEFQALYQVELDLSDQAYYAWYMENPTPITPVPYKGRQGLFWVKDSVVEAVV